MGTAIKLSDSLQKTIALEQRALADGGTLVSRNNTVNNIPYVLLNHIKPTFVIDPAAYKAGKLYSVVPNTTILDVNGVARNSIKTAFNETEELQVFSINEPAINWINGRPYINSERESTNLIEQSEDYAIPYWNKASTSIVTNDTPSIINGELADRVVQDVGVSGSINVNLSITSNTDIWAGSAYIKKEATDSFAIFAMRFQTSTFTGGGIQLNKKTGNFTTAISFYGSGFGNALTADVTSVGDYWYVRFTVENTDSANTNLRVFFAPSYGNALGDGTQVDGDAVIAGIQVEQASEGSSTIPTNGTTVTRVIDRLDTGPIPAILNDTQGTVYFEFYITKFTDLNRYLFCLRDGAQTTEVFLRAEIASFPRTLTFILNDNVSGSEAFRTTNAVQPGLNKMILVYDGTNVFMTLNGITTTSTVTYTTTKNLFRLGEQRGGGQNLDDNIGLTWYKDTPITQAEAERETML